MRSTPLVKSSELEAQAERLSQVRLDFQTRIQNHGKQDASTELKIQSHLARLSRQAGIDPKLVADLSMSTSKARASC